VFVKSSRKQAKAGENENAFICFLLFFGIETFQRAMTDSNDFFSAASSQPSLIPPHPPSCRPSLDPLSHWFHDTPCFCFWQENVPI
jgi:hypothetical protein